MPKRRFMGGNWLRFFGRLWLWGRKGGSMSCAGLNPMPEAAAFRRDPAVVMRLARMGSAHPTRLSFLRAMLRRWSDEGWRFDRPVWKVNKRGVGRAVYRAIGPKRTYSLVAFAHDLPDDNAVRSRDCHRLGRDLRPVRRHPDRGGSGPSGSKCAAARGRAGIAQGTVAQPRQPLGPAVQPCG